MGEYQTAILAVKNKPVKSYGFWLNMLNDVQLYVKGAHQIFCLSLVKHGAFSQYL